MCIITRRHGRICSSLDGNAEYEIDLELALEKMKSGHNMLDYTIISPKRSSIWGEADTLLMDQRTTEELITIIGQKQCANIVVEAIPSNTKGDGEPAVSFIKAALNNNLHVVSANKSPLAFCSSENNETYWELQSLALRNSVMYRHESAVMDGVPIFSLWQYTMPHAKLISIRGCLNSTTTMIITRMEGNLDDISSDGESFQEALDAAKNMGIVEEDESLDIDGYDAAVKLRALMVVLSHSDKARIPTMDEIARDSIRDITREDIHEAYANDRKKYRLVATAKLVDDLTSALENTEESDTKNSSTAKRWEASVKLKLINPSDPLYNLTGTDASVQFCTDVLGPITMTSSKPTLVDTAYGLFSDIVHVANEA